MLETIRKNLAAQAQIAQGSEGMTPAAVLLPLLYKDDELHVLLTKRTQTVKVHKGQISFPGGVHDAGDDSLLVTALREAHEEIGLRPEDVEILGSLQPTATVTTKFLIHTFVGFISYPYPFKPNGREVAEILLVPFCYLADDGHWSRRFFHGKERPFEAYFISYGDHLIWGATARILKTFFVQNGVEMNIRSVMGS